MQLAMLCMWALLGCLQVLQSKLEHGGLGCGIKFLVWGQSSAL